MAELIPIATAALIQDGQILLAHRHPQRRWYPDCWDLVGGHIEAGESAREAVIRECHEELGIQIIDPQPIEIGFSDPTLDVQSFVVRNWEGEPRNVAPDEHDDLRWFTAAQLPGLELADAACLPTLLPLLGHAPNT